MKLELDIDRDLDANEIERVKEVVSPLIKSGALFGVRGGKAIIHFDADGIFQGVELQYWPWRKRRA